MKSNKFKTFHSLMWPDDKTTIDLARGTVNFEELLIKMNITNKFHKSGHQISGACALATKSPRLVSRLISFPLMNQIKSKMSPPLVLVIFVAFTILLGQLGPTTQASTIKSSLFKRSTSDTDQRQPHQREPHQTALNYLLFSSSTNHTINNNHNNINGSLKVEELLKDSNHSHISDTINLQLANSIWAKMHENVLEYARQKGELARPTINKLLEQANISSVCSQSINDIIDRLEKLDDWAVRMYNSFGDFPANGFFEGTHTSMGDYHQCVNLEPNQWIGKAQYCTFKFQPILPKRPRYHNILATIDNLANTTRKEDMFAGLAKKAHYFYYTKLRLATCMPSKCDKNDLRLLGEQIAVNTYLQFQGASCLERSSGFNPDGAQVFALTVLILLASVSLLGTLVHLLNLRSLFANHLCLLHRHCPHHHHHHHHHLATDLSLHGRHFSTNQNIALQQQTLLAPNQQKVCTLATPVVVTTTATTTSPNTTASTPTAASISAESIGSSSSSSSTIAILNAIDFLMHFSILKNAKKLFDTSTSRRGNSRASSLVPGMKEAVNGRAGGAAAAAVVSGDSSISSGDSTSGSQSDSSSSVDGRSNDISCVHGLRFWTISWIILGHTMQYTEWAGFGRAYQVEQNITSFLLHPLLNATFSVDTFFLISGLLTTYVTWTITRGQYWRFNKFAFLISRYLRLMPQVLLVILLFIVFPLMGDGPYWRGLIQKESDRCKQNWWVSALFLQSFYRSDQICNLVTWWLSIEMFYHFVSIIVIIALLHSARKGILAALLVGGSMTVYSCYLHYINHYPPNMLPTLLQRYEIWDSIVLKYFWTPYPHAPSYFTGLLLGYALYNRSISRLTRRQVRLGWLTFAVCYLSILFGTYHWNNNAPYSRVVATVYYNVSQVFWSLATGWAILACALGNGGWLNSFLSSTIFIPLGRATYMTYLSHMIIVMAYPAKMNLLIEPSYVVFLYIFISNLFLSYALGIFLTLVYESPILHLQKLLVSRMAMKFNEDGRPNCTKQNTNISTNDSSNNNNNINNNNNNIININSKNNNSDEQKAVRALPYKQQIPTLADDEQRIH